jgi:hypothetical protein
VQPGDHWGLRNGSEIKSSTRSDEGLSEGSTEEQACRVSWQGGHPEGFKEFLGERRGGDDLEKLHLDFAGESQGITRVVVGYDAQVTMLWKP